MRLVKQAGIVVLASLLLGFVLQGGTPLGALLGCSLYSARETDRARCYGRFPSCSPGLRYQSLSRFGFAQSSLREAFVPVRQVFWVLGPVPHIDKELRRCSQLPGNKASGISRRFERVLDRVLGFFPLSGPADILADFDERLPRPLKG